VTDENRDSPRPFDVRTVEYLLKLMTEHDLSEIELKEGDQRIRLRKGAAIPNVFHPVSYAPPVHPGASNPAPAGASPSPASPSPPPAPTRNLIEIKSPMVGTFYSKPKPDKPDFVSVGAPVKPDTVVCIIEAMKVFNDITADCTGVIAEILVQDRDPVEYGTVLFRVDPSG